MDEAHARGCIKPAMDYFNEHLKAKIMAVPLKALAIRYSMLSSSILTDISVSNRYLRSS